MGRQMDMWPSRWTYINICGNIDRHTYIYVARYLGKHMGMLPGRLADNWHDKKEDIWMCPRVEGGMRAIYIFTYISFFFSCIFWFKAKFSPFGFPTANNVFKIFYFFFSWVEKDQIS